MVAFRTIAFALAIEAAIASPLYERSTYAVKNAHPKPQTWTRVAAAPAEKKLNLQIGLKQANFAELERQLYEVSDPESKSYGQHLDADAVNKLIAPSPESLVLVEGWLASNGIERSQISYSAAKDWLSFDVPVSKAESLLNTKYSVFQHTDGTKLLRTTSYGLPQSLHEHIDVVTPTNTFLDLQKARTSFQITPELQARANGGPPDVSTVCNATDVTPACLATLYETIDYHPLSDGKNKLAFTNFLEESPNRTDLRLFLQEFRPQDIKAADEFNFISIANGTTSQNFSAEHDVEANLDVQTLTGLAYPIPLTAYTTGGVASEFTPDLESAENQNEPYDIWLKYVLAQPNNEIPQVISNSYADNEQTVPRDFAERICKGYAQLGVRGVSVLFGSGDSGVGGVHESTPDQCRSNDGKNITQFLPSFPSSCPYVTVVGGTQNFAPEIVATNNASNYASGGGFSNYFPAPAYQKDAVKGYLKTIGNLYSGLYNATGRAYPDVAAQGSQYVVYYQGRRVHVGGTSAATPTFSAVVSLLNDARLRAGKPVLGFLNPFIYKRGYKAMTDITDGSAVGCGLGGLPATKGWDAVTGFGTPLFKDLKKEVLA